jgi:hypothetical protein
MLFCRATLLSLIMVFAIRGYPRAGAPPQEESIHSAVNQILRAQDSKFHHAVEGFIGQAIV